MQLQTKCDIQAYQGLFDCKFGMTIAQIHAILGNPDSSFKKAPTSDSPTDAYRWLEDANTPETKTFVADENKLTASVLDKIAFRPKVAERLEKVWNAVSLKIPYFF